MESNGFKKKTPNLDSMVNRNVSIPAERKINLEDKQKTVGTAIGLQNRSQAEQS